MFDAGDAERMQGLGFNLLRLPISWSALEPTPGAYDRSYLDRIAAVVDACTRRGILVIIDFHQDAFSKEIGQDGAPRWVLDLLLGPGNYPYLGGPLDDLTARRFAPATVAAFHDFFADQAGHPGALRGRGGGGREALPAGARRAGLRADERAVRRWRRAARRRSSTTSTCGSRPPSAASIAAT